MAELVRQSSRFRFMKDFLVAKVGLPAADADGYAVGLVEQGYDSAELFADLSREELERDFGFKKGHARKAEMYLAGLSSRRFLGKFIENSDQEIETLKF